MFTRFCFIFAKFKKSKSKRFMSIKNENECQQINGICFNVTFVINV